MKLLNEEKSKWIKAGYHLFGQIGLEFLKVERRSMLVELKHSSFYQHFEEIATYEKQLLKHHINRFMEIGNRIKRCKQFQPDVINEITSHKLELIFHRQLLIHETIPRYRSCYNEARLLTEPSIFQLWSAYSYCKKKQSKESSLYDTVKDYYLQHFNPHKKEQIQATFEDIKLLLQPYDQ